MVHQSQLIDQIKGANLFDAHTQLDFKETPFSYVFLTKDRAYKIKKAIDVGSLRLSKIENRQQFCAQEVDINKNSASELYVGVRMLYQRDDGTLTFEPTKNPVEVMVEMKRFSEDKVFLNMLESDTLEEAHLTQLADVLAQSHINAEPTKQDNFFESTRQDVFNTLDALGAIPDVLDPHLLESLKNLFEQGLAKNEALIKKRALTHVKFFERDVSLEGACLHEGAPNFFNGMSPHKEPHKSDTMADLAALFMDLFYRNCSGMAFLVLNRYLKRTDDFEGLPLLPLYGALQAIKRSVGHCLACLEANNQQVCERENKKARLYAELALLFLRETPQQRIIAFGGFSGAGKTTLARPVAQRVGAVHVRADAVRKHLWGVPISEKAPREAYGDTHQEKTYKGLQTRAGLVLEAGFNVVVDGVFASESQRDGFSHFAKERNIPFTAVWCVVPQAIALKRIKERSKRMGKSPNSAHEKEMFFDAGRITWHRLDTVYGKEHVKQRFFELLQLSTNTL